MPKIGSIELIAATKNYISTTSIALIGKVKVNPPMEMKIEPCDYIV